MSDILLSVWPEAAMPPSCAYCHRPLGFRDGQGPLNPDEPRYEMTVRQMIHHKVTSTCSSCGNTSRVVPGEPPWAYRMERTTPREQAGVLGVSDLLRLIRYDDGSWELIRHASTRLVCPMSYEEVVALAKELPRIVNYLERGPIDLGEPKEDHSVRERARD